MSIEQSIDNLAQAMNRLADYAASIEQFLRRASESSPQFATAYTQTSPSQSAPIEGEFENADIGEVVVEEVKVEPAKKRGRPAGSAKAKEAAPAEVVKEEVKKEPEGEKITKEQVRAWMGKVQAAADSGTAFKLLSNLGFRGLGECPEEKYPLIVKAAQAKLKELGVGA